jgi:hypothetical protein
MPSFDPIQIKTDFKEENCLPDSTSRSCSFVGLELEWARNGLASSLRMKLKIITLNTISRFGQDHFLADEELFCNDFVSVRTTCRLVTNTYEHYKHSRVSA